MGDLLVVIAVLPFALPLMLCIAIAIKLTSPGPVLFRQERVGRYGRPFFINKFRSMYVDAEARLPELMRLNEARGAIFKMRDDPRITPVGRFIRRLSLDELPQLFNVLDGTMSLVGPRPPLPRELANYETWHFTRLEATPGITGYWQVERGDDPSFDEMVRLDLTYIDGWSLWMDLKIVAKTVPAMVVGKGAY
jgi:lipopolysaccharide/colanic/teichoic acid biosynthesis glycosyltransferase